ncbi:SpoIIAA family protein [Halomonas sp. WWR20]
MIEFLVPIAPHVVAMRVSGKFSESELEQAIDSIEKKKRDESRISVYAEIDTMNAMSIAAILKDMGYGLSQLRQLSRFYRIAVITDRSWIKHMVEWENRLLTAMDVRVFPTTQKDAAADWVRQTPMP